MKRATPPHFEGAVARLARDGRVKGFEQLRDELLTHWRWLAHYRDPLAIIKTVLETDRHALFAQLSEQKAADKFQLDAWRAFQKYLEGEVSEPPRVGGAHASSDDQDSSPRDEGAIHAD